MEFLSLEAIKTLGFPSAITLMFAFALWRVLRFFAPRVDRVVDGHVELMAVLKTHIPEINRKLDAGVCRYAGYSTRGDGDNGSHSPTFAQAKPPEQQRKQQPPNSPGTHG